VTVHRKHPLAICEKCPFEKAPFVPTQNPQPRAKLAVVGEAPGAYEAGRGIPFTGPSGRLLDQVLSHHGYERSEVMVTNVCLCRPQNNDDPPKAAVAACKPRLDAELAHSGVDKILAVGGTAASVLIDPKKKISALRVGPPKPYIENPEVKVVASWHPAYCLRSPDNFPSFVSDTGKLKGRIYEKWNEPKYRVFTTEDTIIEAANRLMELDGPLIIDIEAGMDKDFSFAHPEHYTLLCVGIAYARGRAVVFAGAALYVARVVEVLKKLFRTKKLIGHNGKFDLNGMFPVFGELELFADTMLMSYCLDERPGLHGLKKLAIELLGAPDWEAAIKQYIPRGKDYGAIPKHILYKYNAFDVGATWDLYELFSSKFGDRERKQHDFLIQASNALMGLERAGITFDEKYSEELHEMFDKELYDLEVQISGTTGRNLNPRSPMQILKWFADEGFRLETTNADTLEAVLARQGLKDNIRTFIEQLLLHRRRTKLDGTYVKGFQKRVYKGRVFTTYTLHGTTSGRLASKNPNLQNIVRDKRIKKQFTVSHPENVLIQVDQKQSEGRVITTLAHDEYLASIFRDPTRDIFNELTEQIYGSVWNKEERVKIKSVFYGLCVPIDTKILTRRGWLTYDKVIPGVDETIGYDKNLAKSRWTKIEEVLTYNDADVYSFGHSNITFETTPNHRWISEQRKSINGKRTWVQQFTTTKNINNDTRLLLAFDFDSDSKIDITEQEAAILGWAYSDGSVDIKSINNTTAQGLDGRRRGVKLRICQDKTSEHYKTINELLIGYNNTKYEYENRSQVWWNIPAETARDLLIRANLIDKCDPVQFALSMSNLQRKAFFNAVDQAEGTKSTNIISQSSGWLNEVIKIIGYLEGYLVKSRLDNSSETQTKNHFKHRLAKPILTGQMIHRYNPRKTDVWCVKTELGTWTMHQNGLTVLTGNSYGRGAASIGTELGIPIEESRELLANFKALIPATVSWQASITHKILAGEDLTTSFGRKRSFWLITDQNRADVINEALSFLPQSISSDITLTALIKLQPRLHDLATIRLTIHDALIVECKETDADEVTSIINEEMTAAGRAFTNYVPFVVDASIGKRWSEL
jgi:uracil-DNA glycosylase family 4